MYQDAIRLFRRELINATSKVDFSDNVRGYWSEWGICEGRLVGEGEHYVNTWLQGVSLSDRLNPAPLTEGDVKLICAGLGVPLGKLATNSVACPFAHARRAVIDIGRRVSLDARSASYFDKHEKAADELETTRPKDLNEAVAWLAKGVIAAGAALTDTELTRLTHPGEVSFNALHTMLERSGR